MQIGQTIAMHCVLYSDCVCVCYSIVIVNVCKKSHFHNLFIFAFYFDFVFADDGVAPNWSCALLGHCVFV